MKKKAILILTLPILLLALLPDVRLRAKAYGYVLYFQTQPLPKANSLPNPVPKQRFIDTWHAPRGGGRKHEGVDIFAKRGTPIVSNIDGIVWKMENNRLGGTSVWLAGAGGAFHYYTHLDKYANIKPYQYVERGTVIGYVGNTGNAKNTPPHLHYGIYVNGKAINPYPLLNKKS